MMLYTLTTRLIKGIKMDIFFILTNAWAGAFICFSLGVLIALGGFWGVNKYGSNKPVTETQTDCQVLYAGNTERLMIQLVDR